MKSETADFQEIFASSNVAESLNASAPVLNSAPEPALPLDDSLWNFLDDPLSKAGQEIQDAALIAEISGYEFTAAPQVSTPDPAPPSTVFADFIKRTTRVLGGAPRHRRAVETIVSKAKSTPRFAAMRDDSHWGTLVQACADFVTSAILHAGV